MDKNQLTGFILIFAILLGWTWWSAPTEAEVEKQRIVQDSIRIADSLAMDSLKITQTSLDTQKVVTLSDSAQMVQNAAQYGNFASSTVGQAKEFVLQNDLATVILTNQGGRIKEVILEDHYKILQDTAGNETKVKLKLLEDEKNRFEYMFNAQGKKISTQDLIFDAQPSGNAITFVANTPDGGKITQRYELLADSYKIDYDVSFAGLENTIDKRDEPIQLNWVNYLDKLELNEQFERFYTTVYFKEADESSDYCNCRGDANEERPDEQIQWVSNVNQFFNSSLIAKDVMFDGGDFKTEMEADDAPDLKKVTSVLNVPYDYSPNSSLSYQWYVGPNEFNRLDAFDNGLEEVIPFGRSIFGSINRWFVRPFFNFLSGLISSKGVVIIVLIFIIKVFLYPLMYKMLHSQAKMAALKPELAGLKEKFKDEPQKVQMETMKIYREYGVSPLGGCLPMVLQMPIWYALFRFFPASITFRQEPFLWAHDLSSYDVFFNHGVDIPFMGDHLSLFTLLWAVTTIMYTYYNTKHMDMTANPAMKYVQYFMPLMFLGFFNTYASGLTCYMFFSNLFNILQTVITKRFVFDDDKIKAELIQNKNKPKKKGGFQARMEEALQKQQNIAKKSQNQKKNSKRK